MKFEASTPAHHQYPQPSPSPSSHLGLKLFCCCLATGVVLLFLYLGWTETSQPPKPEFQVISFSVANMHVSATDMNMTANWKAKFQIYNPSTQQKLLYSRRIRSYISYKREKLISSQIQMPQQNSKNVTHVDVDYSLVEPHVGGQVVYWIGKDMERGKMSFNLTLNAVVYHKLAGWIRSRDWLIRVSCGNMEIRLSRSGESGNLIGGVKDCEGFWSTKGFIDDEDE